MHFPNRPIIIALLLIASLAVKAQIAAPDFQCIRGDTLIWNNSPSNCGPFLGTRILVATGPLGPYTERATITDPAADRFHDPNPNGVLRFYYLVYDYDCPGVTSPSSDTLDNRIPGPPNSSWVSIENNTAVVHWTPSSSPQTSGYLVYREAPQGFEIIGTVNDAATVIFRDNSFASPPVGVNYRVTAVDPCGNNSLFGPLVTTASLEASGGSGCVSEISFTADAGGASNPRPLDNWTLFASVNGGAFVPAGTATDPGQLIYGQANDGENVCFYAEAIPQGLTDRPVRTSITCADVAITQPVRPFSLLGGSFNENGSELRLFFPWDELAEANLLRVEFVDNNSVSSTFDVDPATVTGPLAMVDLTGNTLPSAPFTLSLRAEDVCDNVVITNNLAPVFLNGSATMPGVNDLSWTAFDNEVANGVSYQLIRTGLDGSETTVFRGPETSFTDRAGTDDENLASACYRVVALVDQPDGSSATYTSRVVCLEQQPMVFLPNVFMPNSDRVANQAFCPGFSRQPTGAYQLDIFDRWGGHLFSTSTPGDCWSGEARGQVAASGVYLYVLRMEIGGRTIERTGDVTLLR